MPVTYPVAFPTSISPKSVTWTAQTNNISQRSPWNSMQQVMEYPGGSWGIEIQLPPLTANQVRELAGFLASLHGEFGTFSFGAAPFDTPRGTWSGTPKVRASGGQDYLLYGAGFTPHDANTCKRGDMIQVGTRLYMVTADQGVDGLGNLNIDIWPILREIPAENTPIVSSSPVGVFRMASDAVSWTTNEDSYSEAVILAVEAL